MITEYRPVTWTSGEPISSAKLAAMAANDQALFEAMPTILFNNKGIKKSKGTKIYAFTVYFAPKNFPLHWTDVYFGDVFSVGCSPVVTAGVNATMGGDRYHVNTRALGGHAGSADHRGLEVILVPDKAVGEGSWPGTGWDSGIISHDVYVNLIAVGF